ncbi:MULTISPECIES: EamA family transporter [Rhodomicrobium]|uniref:aromatic amino acid exporter YddG n=1 Tax=Rhodomicrobium TaxID=1068 RepID=UPI000B4C0945|nr:MULTISPECIES: EamA family transporter [Rhodomicrobium]
MSRRTAATLLGLLAVLLWATLAPMTVLTSGVPPLQLVATSFSIGALIGLAYLIARPDARAELRQVTWASTLLGVGGLLGFHFFYFLSLTLAPPLEANLVNYLWPLLIVLFSALLPNADGRLRAHHLIGALAAFAGALLAITTGAALPTLNSGALAGYGVALLSALTWAGYSVLSRLFAAVPSSAVTLYCAVTAAAAALAHFAFEPTTWPLSPVQAVAIIALGLGPVGLAFYVWDHGCKHGDLRVLGASAYFAPLLSTVLLVAFGLAEGSPVLWLAAAAITGGALLASKDMLYSRRQMLASDV